MKVAGSSQKEKYYNRCEGLPASLTKRILNVMQRYSSAFTL